MNGEDIIFAMTSLGFENYAEVLKIYLAKYRQVNPSSKVTKLMLRLTRMLVLLLVERGKEVWKRIL